MQEVIGVARPLKGLSLPIEKNVKALHCQNSIVFKWPDVYMQSTLQDKCSPTVTPQLAAQTTCINLSRYIYSPVSQFLLRV